MGAPAQQVQEMFGAIAPRYDLTNAVLSGGMHLLWQHKLTRAIPFAPDRSRKILDLCTGTGALIPGLVGRGASVTGADFCQGMLDQAEARHLHRLGKARDAVKLICADAMNLPFPDQEFDFVTVAYGVRNIERLEKGLSEIHRVLKVGGRALILEFGQPRGLMAPLFGFYSRYLMPLIGGLLTGHRQAYEYLPETARNFPCGEQFLAVARAAGFTDCNAESLTGGIAYIYSLRSERPASNFI